MALFPDLFIVPGRSSGGSAMENSMRRSDTTRNTPTPHATDRMRIKFGTDGTCDASTYA